MNFIHCIIVLFLTTFTIAAAPPIQIIFIVQSQDTEYHYELSEKLRENIIKQSIELQPIYSIKAHLLHKIFNYPGGWTIHNLIPQLMLLQSKSNIDTNTKTKELKDDDEDGDGDGVVINDMTRWIVFCEAKTKVNVKLLIERLNDENHTQPVYLGFPLYDHEPTIIHHFAFFENPKWFQYPMLRAGVVFSMPLFKSIADVYANQNSKLFKQQFSIDAGHELARFIYDNIQITMKTITTTATASLPKNHHVSTLHPTGSDTSCNAIKSSRLHTIYGKDTTPSINKPEQTKRNQRGTFITVDTTHVFDVSQPDFCTMTTNVIRDKHGNEIAKANGNASANTISKKTSIIKKQKIILRKASYICPTATWENSSKKGSSNINNDDKSCAMYAEQMVNPASAKSCDPVKSEEIYFAVKTCSKYHSERLPIIQATWTPYAKHVKYFSDVEDRTIPTISTGITNVETGHCAKTLQILKLAFEDIENHNNKQHINQINNEKHQIKWIFLSDDDTLLSVSGVCEVLGCYNSMDEIYLGERYGFRLFAQDGFNYITGGGGIVFSLPVVKLILQHCSCPSPTAPDDMILGSCLHSLQLKTQHSSRFHQARPNDYPLELLMQEPPVSFHKFWQLDPIDVYKRWFAPVDHKPFPDKKFGYQEQSKNDHHFKAHRLLMKTDSLNLNTIPVSMMTSVGHSKGRHVDL